MSHIFLYGPPGSGKSTVGKTLARNLRMAFIDLDRAIETKAGVSIGQIMMQAGESGFRDLESAALADVVGHASRKTGSRDQIIALGGGTLLRVENRALAEAHGTIVLLTAELSTLLDRLKDDAGKRPLLAGNSREKLIALVQQRQGHYASFNFQVPVNGKTAAQNALEIQTRLGRFHLSAMGKYDVLVENVERLGGLLAQRGLLHPLVVTDANVAQFHAERVLASLRSAGFSPNLLNVPAGESHKTLETVRHLWHGFLEAGLHRKSTVIALGGGVTGDLAGFAASTYMRGIDWVCVPTTLLAMVDASLGGKTGFDLPEGKNLIGSFHAPRLVLMDPRLLNTLPAPEFISGMAEVVKHGIIADPDLFSLCARGLDGVKARLEAIVKRAMAVKITIIEADPYERDIRARLNLGHTVGHAVEAASRFQLRHGEAVAIGMVAEARLAQKLGVAGKGTADLIGDVLIRLGLPVDIPKELRREDILRHIQADKKKHASAIRFALPADIGRVELVDVADLDAVL